jgi:hypothetical protein
MHRFITRLAVITLFATTSACGGGDSTAPDPKAAVAGTYTLTQINGGNLPVTVFANTAGRIELTGGSLTLRSDGSYTESLAARTVYTSGAAPQTTTDNENGTFTVIGSQITFSIPPSGSSSGLSYTGAVSGGVLTYTYEGNAFRYQKN